MQSKQRIEKLKLAQRLLNNEPEPRAMRCWRIVNGVPDDNDYPDHYQEGDIVFQIEIIKDTDAIMQTHRKRLRNEN
ncbi:MAG: hypothetical protein A2W85_06330 [Bacteroidetes bacterium GWF2_41_31]|nr:MAG: hypothetical protein A2W85_06330 [Bacteroidetes bacterium GWF2_41_31]